MADDDRREAVPFDPRHFEKRAARGERLSTAACFDEIYRARHWGAAEPASGAGASRTQTAVLERELPGLLGRLGIRSLLDVPCGDFEWMQHVDLADIEYVGADIVPAIVEANRQRFAGPGRRFVQLDLLTDPVPTADLVLCRDLLVHFSFADIFAALAAVRRSGARYLLATTFPGTPRNDDIVTGDWRPLNLTAPPFDLPPPLDTLVEGCTEGDGRFADKSLGLWPLNDEA